MFDPRRGLVHLGLRFLVWRRSSDTVTEFLQQRAADPVDPAPPTGKIVDGLNVDRNDSGPIDVYRVYTPSPTGRYFVFIHGGAYLAQIGAEHWAFVLNTVRQTNATAVVPVYRLAPEANAADVVREVTDVIKALIAEAGADKVVVVGDSAGGGLALAAAQQLASDGVEQPAHLALIAPWVDLSMTHPDQAGIERHDLMLSRDYLAEAGRAYAGDLPVDDWRVSPLNGELAGLAPMTVFVGTHDILVTDARQLTERAKSLGVEVRLYEESNMQHVYPLFPIIAEAKAARRRIYSLVSGQQ